METSEHALIGKAKRYLKDVYGEDTISMTVEDKSVEDFNGVLAVESPCSSLEKSRTGSSSSRSRRAE